MKFIRLVAWGLIAAIVVFVAVRVLTGGPDGAAPSSAPSSSSSSSQAADAVPGTLPGGPFVLTSHTGAIVSDSDFRGRYMLVYFGYSACPDVCPLELQKMTAALLDLEAEGLDTTPLQPLFISFDPERDTPQELAGFVPQFHPRLIGLTGTVEAVTKAAKAYKIYFRKLESAGAAGYLMDHSSVVFLMGPDGGYRAIFTSRDTPQTMAESLRPLLKATAP